MAKPWVRSLVSVGRLLISALTCLSAAVLLLSLSARTLYQPSPFEAAAKGDFRTALYAEVQDHLQSEALFYGIPYEVLQTGITQESLDKAVAARMASVYSRLCEGEQLAPVAVDAAPFEAAIAAYFKTLPVEEQPLDTNAAATIAGEIVDSTALVAASGIAERTLSLTDSVFRKTAWPRRIGDCTLWAAIGLCVLTVLSLIPIGRSFRSRLQSTAGALFVGTALVAIPVWLFERLDFPSSLVIAESALREYVTTLLYTAIGQVSTLTRGAFILSAALLVIATVILALKKEKTDQPAG